MSRRFDTALQVGAGRVAGWADLLDQINVFPVSDGDTGRNLVLTFSPLLRSDGDCHNLGERVLLSARGNSGNIAAQFLSGFLEATERADLPLAVARGRDLAWQAVPNPRAGTMLSFFDALSEALDNSTSLAGPAFPSQIIGQLSSAVLATTDQLPELRQGNVVDSGALGMLLFFDGFLRTLAGQEDEFLAVTKVFDGRIQLADNWATPPGKVGCCVDAVLEAEGQLPDLTGRLESLGESVVASQHGDTIKIHLHANDAKEVREQLRALGSVVSFASDDMESQQKDFQLHRGKPVIHIVTDAAGSVTRQDASRLSFSLLDSYINLGTLSIPETHLDPDRLYDALRSNVPVSTSQASTFERHQHYERVISLHGRALYACVGAAYTGNFETVMAWKQKHDPDNLLEVIDTGAASGRLALVALATAEMSLLKSSAEAVITFAAEAVPRSREYVFLDQLRYLAAGGRLSKTKAFFGDLLSKKPVVSPMRDGAEKVAVLRGKEEQVAFALARLTAETHAIGPLWIMLEYTDNEEWVREIALGQVSLLRPNAVIMVQPFSRTSGAHMGPGTWGIAFLDGPVEEP